MLMLIASGMSVMLVLHGTWRHKVNKIPILTDEVATQTKDGKPRE